MTDTGCCHRGGLLVGKPPSFVSSFKRNKVWPGGTELSCKTAPRREKKARASVAEVAQVIIRLVRQIKPRPSCLCARRSRALVCDAALRCYNPLPALILRVDPLHATLAIRSFFCRKAPEGSTYSTVLFALHALSVQWQTYKPRWHCGSRWRGSRVPSTQSQSIHRIRKYPGCDGLRDLIGHWT